MDIKDKLLFDELLITYVDKALKFYDNYNFNKDAMAEGISKEKIIMTLLWSNATWEDYSDPCNFLRKRINFFECEKFNDFLDKSVVLGRSELLFNSNVSCKICKCRIENETPDSLEFVLSKDIDGNLEMYKFPKIYFGIDNDVVYLYAIQNIKNKDVNRSFYYKKINRLMYKVNEGLDINNDNVDNYGVGNLKDVTPSFLIASNIALGLFKKFGYFKVCVPSVLITRWNSKKIANDFKKEHGVMIKELDQDEIQKNLTDKFIRTFLRLSYHHSGIKNLNYVSEDSSSLLLNISSFDKCDNELLAETYSFFDTFVRSRNR